MERFHLTTVNCAAITCSECMPNWGLGWQKQPLKAISAHLTNVSFPLYLEKQRKKPRGSEQPEALTKAMLALW
jgi:hypothetical protein